MNETGKRMNFLCKNDYNASVIVTSDTCSKDSSKDTSGEYVIDQLRLFLRFKTVNKYIVEDDKEAIKSCIMSILKDALNVLIITVGGTGLCPRDVTPEATSALYDRRCHGIETSLYLVGLRSSPHAALSRLTAGIVKNCLIINFPGKLQACKECFPRIESILEHALEQINFDSDAIQVTHEKQNKQSISSDVSSVKEKSVETKICLNQEIINERPLKKTSSLKAEDSNDICSINYDKRSSATASIEEGLKSNSGALNNIVNHLKEMNLKSTYPMIEYQEALNILKSFSKYICETNQEVKLSEEIDLFSEVIGRNLAHDIYSKSLIPPYPCSTVDGYVLNLSSTMLKYTSCLGTLVCSLKPNLESFEATQQEPDQLHNFFCYQVNTGGRIPEKDFVVIPVEDTSGLNENKTSVCIDKVKLENNTKYIRKPGVDLNSKDCLRSGTKIGPIELSVIISMGHKKINLVKRPHIGLITTGDELVSFENYCKDNTSKDKVVDSNGPLLSNVFKSKNYSVLNLGIIKDNPEEILLKIQTGFIVCDIIVITGGASMGSKDHVKDVVERMGGIIHFGRVNIKPGKPAAFASIEYGGRKKFIFCLPGNPVSAYITTLSLVIPFIEHGLRGRSGNKLPLTINDIGDLIEVELADIIFEDNNQHHVFDGRLEFVRAKLLLNDCGGLQVPYKATVSTRQQSSCLLNLLDCDCLIVIDPSLKDSTFIIGQCYRAIKLKN